MVQEAATADVEVTSYPPPKHGKHEVLFPVCLPDEGTFQWLDWFLEKNPNFMELSDRKIIEWATRSGLTRSRALKPAGSNDRPDMCFGIPQLDDGSIKAMLSLTASVQGRDLVIPEVKANLLREERAENLRRFRAPHLRRVAQVMLGEPEEEVQQIRRDKLLSEKQERLDAEWRARQSERHLKRLLDKRAREVEQQRKQAQKRQRLEAGAEEKEKAEEGDAPDASMADEEKEGEAMAEEDTGGDQEETGEEERPLAELTEEDLKGSLFKRPGSTPDLIPYVLNTTFMRFTLPTEEEGFDELRFAWQPAARCEELMREWMLEQKVTSRIEDLQPSDWFKERWTDWQRELQAWHVRHMEFKDPTKRSAAAAAAAAAQAKLKPPMPMPMKPMGESKEVEEPKEGDDSKVKASEEEEEAKPTEPDSKAAQEDKDPLRQLEEEVDSQDLDVFGVEDVCDIGGGEPLFANFAFEDWALLSLRFELHLLVHAFRHDCDDPERVGIHPEHILFYYSKYFKKPLIPKNYGVESIEELVQLAKDAIIISKRLKVMDSQLSNDLESNEIFVKLTEEARRDRQRRIDAGDESAQLHFTNRPDPAVTLGPRTTTRPVGLQPNSGPGAISSSGRNYPPLTSRSFAQARPGSWYPQTPRAWGLRSTPTLMQQRAAMLAAQQGPAYGMRGGYQGSWKGGHY